METLAEYVNRPPLTLTQHEREMIVAFFLMDEYGDDDPDARLLYAAQWFRKVEHMMQEPHNGDCVKVPMTCTRCVLEKYADMARRISAAMSE